MVRGSNPPESLERDDDAQWIAKRDQAVSFWIQGKTNKEIADLMGVVESTVWRWSKRPEVRELVERYRADVLESVRSRVNSLCRDAVERVAVLMNQNGDLKVALAASKTLLDLGIRSNEDTGAHAAVKVELTVVTGDGEVITDKGEKLKAVKERYFEMQKEKGK